MEWIKLIFKYGITPCVIFSVIVLFKGGKMIYVLVCHFVYYYSDEYYVLTTEPVMPFYHILILGVFSVVSYILLVKLQATIKEWIFFVIVCLLAFLIRLLVLAVEIDLGTKNIALYDFYLPWYLGGGFLTAFIVIVLFRKRRPIRPIP